MPSIVWVSPPVIAFFPISEFSYKHIRFLLNIYVVKSDNEIRKYSYYDIECPMSTRPIYIYVLHIHTTTAAVWLSIPCVRVYRKVGRL